MDTGVEGYEDLLFYQKSRPRLKSALNLGELVNARSTTFELEEATEELTLLDDDDCEEFEGLDVAAFNKSLLSRDASSKSYDAFHALASDLDIATRPFSETEKSMESIHEKDLVKKEVVRAGVGTKVSEKVKVFVKYLAYFEGENEPYDTTALRKAPTIIDMRVKDLLPGLYVALLSMEVQEVSKFIVRSVLAYGETGCPPRIPPQADVLFVVEVLQIMDEKLLSSPLYMSLEERAKLPFKDILEVAEQLRTEGNGHYKNESPWDAIKKYRKAVHLLEDYPVIGVNEDKDRGDMLQTLYANLAQCYLKLDRPAQACSACKLGLRHTEGEKSVKLLFRFAKAKLQLQDCEAALRLCSQALKLDPRNSEVRELKLQIQKEDKKQTEASKKMYRSMFNKENC